MMKRQRQSQYIRSFFNKRRSIDKEPGEHFTVYHTFSLMNFITELPELVSNTAVRLDSAELSTEPSN